MYLFEDMAANLLLLHHGRSWSSAAMAVDRFAQRIAERELLSGPFTQRNMLNLFMNPIVKSAKSETFGTVNYHS